MSAHDIAQWIGIFVGIITGIGGLYLGILNYRRDTVKVRVFLSLDMKQIGNNQHSNALTYGLIKISNIGRRPVYISHVYLETSNHEKYLATESLRGIKLDEGEKPLVYAIDHESLTQLKNVWDSVRAVVETDNNKFYSNYITQKLSWI